MNIDQPEYRSARIALDNLIDSLRPSRSQQARQGKEEETQTSKAGPEVDSLAMSGSLAAPAVPVPPRSAEAVLQPGSESASSAESHVPRSPQEDRISAAYLGLASLRGRSPTLPRRTIMPASPPPTASSTVHGAGRQAVAGVKRERSASMEEGEDRARNHRRLAWADCRQTSRSEHTSGATVECTVSPVPSKPGLSPRSAASTTHIKVEPPAKSTFSKEHIARLETEVHQLNKAQERSRVAYEDMRTELGNTQTALAAARQEVSTIGSRLGWERKKTKALQDVEKAKEAAEAKLKTVITELDAAKVEMEVVRKERNRFIVRADRLRKALRKANAGEDNHAGVDGDEDLGVSVGDLYKQIGRLEAEKEALERRLAPASAPIMPATSLGHVSHAGDDAQVLEPSPQLDSDKQPNVGGLNARIAELEDMVTDCISTTLEMTEENGKLKQELEAMRAGQVPTVASDAEQGIDQSLREGAAH